MPKLDFVVIIDLLKYANNFCKAENSEMHALNLQEVEISFDTDDVNFDRWHHPSAEVDFQLIGD